jgi:hypothetical protein
MRVLRRRGVGVRLQTTVTEVMPTAIGLPTRQGRLAVDDRIP